MRSAGHRRHGVRFDRRVQVADDGYGNGLSEWTPLLTTRAAFRPQFGREQVESGRLESTLRGTLTILSSAGSRVLTAADRVVFIDGPYRGHVCQVRSIVPTSDAREIELTIESGVAT